MRAGFPLPALAGTSFAGMTHEYEDRKHCLQTQCPSDSSDVFELKPIFQDPNLELVWGFVLRIWNSGISAKSMKVAIEDAKKKPCGR